MNTDERDLIQSAAASAIATMASWLALLLALACLFAIAWYIPSDRRHYFQVFRDFRMELPAATRFVLSIPNAAFPLTAGLIALTLLAIQLVCRAKAGVAIMHSVVAMFCCVVFVAYRECLFQPMTMLMRAVSAPGAGH